MQTERFKVLNVKCGGCATAIRDALSALPGVSQVDVDVATGEVTVAGEQLARGEIANTLQDTGYPEATD